MELPRAGDFVPKVDRNFAKPKAVHELLTTPNTAADH